MQKVMGDRIAIQPWQAMLDRLAALGLTPEEAMTQVWFVDGQGQLSGGAAAANAVLRQVWWGRPLAALYRLPLLGPLEDRLYRWVAANRYRLPGSTPQCKINLDGETTDAQDAAT